MSQYFNPNRKSARLRQKMLTGGSPNSSHNAFLDANVFGKLMTMTLDPNEFIHSSLRAANESGVRSVNIITSPFALFEYLGFQVPKPPELKISQKEFVETPAPLMVERLMKYGIDFYGDKINFDISKLRARVVQMRKFVSDEASVLLDCIVVPFTTPSRSDFIAQALAWDFTMNIQVPGSVHAQYYGEMMTGLGYFHTLGTNFTFSKPAAECMKFRINRYLIKDKGDAGAIKARSSLSFKTKGDHLDREIIHFALVGWHYNTGMPLRTHCFTADPVDDVESRLVGLGAIYTEYYDARYIEHWKSELGKVASAIPGFIHCLSPQSLTIVRSFDCSNYFKTGNS